MALGASASQIALAWLLSRDAVTSLVIGARTLAQFDDNARASDLVLPEEWRKQLDAVSAPALAYPYDFMKRNDGGW